MAKEIFENKIIYYFILVLSFIFCLVSIFFIISLFSNFSLFNFLLVFSLAISNLFAFVSLVEKYTKAVLYFIISLCLYIFFCGILTIINIIKNGFSFADPRLLFSLMFVIILVIVNKYKIRKEKYEDELEEIGKHKD